MSCANIRHGLGGFKFSNINKVALALDRESSGFREICAAANTHVLEPLLQGRLPDDILLNSVDLGRKNAETTILEMMSVKKIDSDEADVSDESVKKIGSDGADVSDESVKKIGSDGADVSDESGDGVDPDDTPTRPSRRHAGAAMAEVGPVRL